MAISTQPDSEENIVAEINITPLTDVALVLLIIFMISSSAILESGLNVKLPNSKSGGMAKTEGKKPTFVTVSKNGEIAVNQKRTAESTLTQALKEAFTLSDHTVVIRGDESIDLGKAVRIMDAAKAAGAERISIATQPSK